MRNRKILIAAAAILALLGIFLAYGQMDLLLDFVNLRYCG